MRYFLYASEHGCWESMHCKTLRNVSRWGAFSDFYYTVTLAQKDKQVFTDIRFEN